MEGVNTVMPLAVRTGLGVLQKAGGQGSADSSAEVRAQAAEAQARRQAEAAQREARDTAEDLREGAQHRQAAARVAAANSGLSLSGSSLLSLEAQEHADDAKLGEVFGQAALRVQGILDSGAEQARSIRLSGRSRRSVAWPGSLLGLGGQVLD